MKASTVDRVDRLRAGFARLRDLIAECREEALSKEIAARSAEGKPPYPGQGAYLFQSAYDVLSNAERACLVDIIELGESDR